MPTAPNTKHEPPMAMPALAQSASVAASKKAEIAQHVMKAYFYNAHASSQTSALQHMLPLLQQAAQLVPLSFNGALQVAEFGCSGGVNSIAPVKLLAETLDMRITDAQINHQRHQQVETLDIQQQQPEQLQIMVTHEDLPSNDFASLFQLLNDPDTSYIGQRYSKVQLHCSAIGRSFYEPLFPAQSVHLGFSCCALHWLRKAPGVLRNTPYWFSPRVTEAERAAGQQQAVSDFATFLQLRAREFVPGGLLVITMIGSGGDEDFDVHTYLRDKVECCWLQLLGQGAITQAELSALSTAANYHRSLSTTLQSMQQQQWEVLHAEVDTTQHAAWQQYESGTMTAQLLGSAYANMWRAINEAMQVQLLAPCKGKAAAVTVVGEYYKMLELEFAADPQCLKFSTNTLLLRRT